MSRPAPVPIPPAPKERWPTLLAEDPAARAALTRAIAAAPPELRAAIEARLDAGADADWLLARTWLWCHALATLGGARFDGLGPENLLRYEVDGHRVLLAPLVVRTPRHRGGEPEDVQRLVRSLETVLHPHRFAVHLRRPLPAGFDPAPVVGAAFGWVREVERGQAGRHAPYDDPEAGVALDLDLLDAEVQGGGGALFVARPSRGPEWLGVLDRRLQRLLVALVDREPDASLIPVLCADPRWGIGRGFQCQWLYGTPREVSVDPEAGARCTWPAHGGGFFADALSSRVAGVWWLEGDGAGGARGWAHDNPWSARPVRQPFPGAILRQVAPGPVLAWSEPAPTTWSLDSCTRT